MKNIPTFEQFLNEELVTKEINPVKFPNPGEKNDPDFFTDGKRDGNPIDDIVVTKDAGIPAKSLKPSQDAVYLGKALGLAIAGVKGGKLEAIISSDNRILDGHHRWAATMFNDPNAKVIGAKAELSIGDLVPVLRQAGDALGNERGGIPSGGDVNIFNATMKDVEACIYDGENMDPNFFNKEKAIAWYEANKAKVQTGLKLIQKFGPPAGAPPRQEMPKIEPNQVNKVAKSLSGGKIDVRFPYNESKAPTFKKFINESLSPDLGIRIEVQPITNVVDIIFYTIIEQKFISSAEDNENAKKFVKFFNSYMDDNYADAKKYVAAASNNNKVTIKTGDKAIKAYGESLPWKTWMGKSVKGLFKNEDGSKFYHTSISNTDDRAIKSIAEEFAIKEGECRK